MDSGCGASVSTFNQTHGRIISQQGEDMKGTIAQVRFSQRSLSEQVIAIDGENHLFGLKLYPHTLKMVRKKLTIRYKYVGGGTILCYYPFLRNALPSIVNVDWEG